MEMAAPLTDLPEGGRKTGGRGSLCSVGERGGEQAVPPCPRKEGGQHNGRTLGVQRGETAVLVDW